MYFGDGRSKALRHVLTIRDEKLYREIEAAAVVKNVPVETMTEELIRDGIAAKQSGQQARCSEPGCSFPAMGGGIKLCRKHGAGYTAAARPKATWPPAAERRARG
jgi:hypothetical protein